MNNRLWIILGLVMILLSYSVIALSPTTLVSYYKMDESSGKLVDATNKYNSSMYGTVLNQTGIINTARGNYSNNDFFNGPTASINNVDYSLNFWIYRTGAFNGDGGGAGGESIFDLGTTDGNFRVSIEAYGTNKTQIYMSRFNQAAYTKCTSSGSIPINNWTMVTATFQSSIGEQRLYFNGVLQCAVNISVSGTTASNNITIGRHVASDATWVLTHAYLDEMGWFNNTLSPADTVTLFNNGVGFAYPFTVAGLANITINQTSPINTSYTNVTSYLAIGNVLNLTAASSWNVSLFDNNILAGSVNNIVNSGLFNISSGTQSPGIHSWYFKAVDNSNVTNTYYTGNYYLSIAGTTNVTSTATVNVCKFNIGCLALACISSCP